MAITVRTVPTPRAGRPRTSSLYADITRCALPAVAHFWRAEVGHFPIALKTSVRERGAASMAWRCWSGVARREKSVRSDTVAGGGSSSPSAATRRAWPPRTASAAAARSGAHSPRRGEAPAIWAQALRGPGSDRRARRRPRRGTEEEDSTPTVDEFPPSSSPNSPSCAVMNSPTGSRRTTEASLRVSAAAGCGDHEDCRDNFAPPRRARIPRLPAHPTR